MATVRSAAQAMAVAISVVTALAMPSSKLSIKAKVSAITLTSCITPVDQMLQLQ